MRKVEHIVSMRKRINAYRTVTAKHEKKKCFGKLAQMKYKVKWVDFCKQLS
jgi:hypothetical protein